MPVDVRTNIVVRRTAGDSTRDGGPDAVLLVGLLAATAAVLLAGIRWRRRDIGDG